MTNCERTSASQSSHLRFLSNLNQPSQAMVVFSGATDKLFVNVPLVPCVKAAPWSFPVLLFKICGFVLVTLGGSSCYLEWRRQGKCDFLEGVGVRDHLENHWSGERTAKVVSLSLRIHNRLVVFTKIERVKCPFPTTCVRWSFQ